MTDVGLWPDDDLNSELNEADSSERDFAVVLDDDDSHLERVLESLQERFDLHVTDATRLSVQRRQMDAGEIVANGTYHQRIL